MVIAFILNTTTAGRDELSKQITSLNQYIHTHTHTDIYIYIYIVTIILHLSLFSVQCMIMIGLLKWSDELYIQVDWYNVPPEQLLFLNFVFDGVVGNSTVLEVQSHILQVPPDVDQVY